MSENPAPDGATPQAAASDHRAPGTATTGQAIPPATIDRSALAALREERLDWRFKAMPSGAFGMTVGEFLNGRPDLFSAGFAGPMLTLDRAAMDHNLTTMAQWCADRGIALAPHGKTTMAPQLFAEQIDHGAWGISAATLGQLRVYRAFGVSRILFANELVDPDGLRWLARELDQDPEFTFGCWVDSVRGVELMTAALQENPPSRPVDVLVEVGAPGGRTGARDRDTALAVAAAAHASPVLRVVGVAGYEGALAHDLSEHDLNTVDTFTNGLRDLVAAMHDAGHFDEVDQVLVTAGGSAYFDRIAEVLTAPWPGTIPVLPILRSGAYIVHDDGLYRRMSPLGRPHQLSGDEPAFRPAMRIWGQVISHPEPGLALVTMGRRDAAFDQDLPEPQVLAAGDTTGAPSGAPRELTDCRVTELADQHAFVSLGAQTEVDVGDWIGFGLSHPCTVFDKWSLIPVVSDGRVVDLVRTYF